MNSAKLRSKLAKFAARFEEERGIECLKTPSPNILICNAGQAVGLTKEHMIDQMVAFGIDVNTLKKFISVKGEAYAFLVFTSTEAAQVFMKKANGHCLKGDIGKGIIYHYVAEIVDDEYICFYDIPDGLTLLYDFLTEEEEQKFYSFFDWTEAPEQEKKLKNRQVKHFGYEFIYGSNDVDLGNPMSEKIPDICNIIWERLKERGFDLGIPDQLTVNKYLPGQGIPSHVDKHSPFGDTILSLSLGSTVVMDWKHHDGKYVPVVVPNRCMMIMKGEARYDWQHGISPRKWDPVVDENRITEINGERKQVRVITSESVLRQNRISLTFRWTRQGPCDCNYKVLCDTAEKKEITEEVAASLEEKHVHEVYEKIAPHFHLTRHTSWPKIARFMDLLDPGSIVLDLGAGNGKNFANRNDIFQIAGERCSGLIAECKKNTKSLKLSNCIRLDLLYPGLIDNCADVILCIAVIHHFSSYARRLRAVSIIYRLLRDGGVALITVWAKDQSDSHYLHKHREQNPLDEIRSIGDSGLSLPVHENRTQFKHNDILVPWKKREKHEKNSNDIESTFLRFYHVFEEDELDELCRKVPGLTVLDSFKEDGNWCVIIGKNVDVTKSQLLTKQEKTKTKTDTKETSRKSCNIN